MATDHNFKVKNGLHVEGADTKLVDAGSGNAKLEVGGTLSIRPAGTTANKHLFELNDYTAAGNVGAATMSTTGDTDFGGRGDFAKDLRIRGDGSNANHGVVRFHSNSSSRLSIDPGNTGSNVFFLDTSGNLTVPGNLTVNGTTTTIDTATLQVTDKNITLNYSTGDSSSTADGAGITIQDAVNSSTDATLLWDATNDEFDFSHAVNITGNLTLSGTIHSTKYDIHNEGSGSLFQTDGYLRFANGNTETVRIDSSGRLGIGTASPGSKLHISNNAAPTDDLTLLTLQNGNSTGDIATPNTFIDFQFKDSNANVVPQARIGAHAGDGGNADSQVKEGKGYLTFHTSNTTNSSGTEAPPERMRIAHDGDVGIGVTDPAAKLHVNGNVLIDGSGGTNGIDFLRPSDSATMQVLSTPDSSTLKIGGGNQSNVKIFAHTTQVASFHLQGGSGKVAIGTTATPLSTLEVHSEVGVLPDATNSSLQLRDTTALAINNGGSIVFSGIYHTNGSHLSSGPFIKAYKLNATSGDYSYGLKFGTRENGVGNNIVGLTITPDQKVGIGTETPSAKLHVVGTISSGAITSTGTSTFDGITFSNGGDRSLTGPLNEDLIINARPNDASEGLHLQINGTDKLFIKQDGSATFAGSITTGDDIILPNNKDVIFRNASGSDDGTKITRAGGNAFRFKYTGNSLIFDALNDNQVSYRNSNDEEVVRVVPNSTPTSSSLDVVGNLRINTTTVIDSSRNLSNIGTISSGDITSTGIITGAEHFKATGNNFKISAGGTHVINVDVNRNLYPQTHNSTDLGFSDTLAFRDLHLVGTLRGSPTIIGGMGTFTSDQTSTNGTINLLAATNGAGAGIAFSDNGTPSTTSNQRGHLTFYHGDGQSFGSGASFRFETSESTLSVLVDGKLLFKEGLVLKPASGTGAGTTLISSTGEIQNATVANSASIARKVSGNAVIDNTGFTHAFHISESSGLSSQVRFTVSGTANSVVISSDVFVLCNHYRDIIVESVSGFYGNGLLTVQIKSNGNEDYSVYLKGNHANATTVGIDVFPLNGETVTFTSTDQGYGGSDRELIHVCRPGRAASSSDNEAGGYVLTLGNGTDNDGQICLDKSASGESRIDFKNNYNIKARIALDSAETLQFKTGNTPSLRMQITEAGVIQFNGAYTFPTSDGSNGQVLTTNGSGALSFTTPSSGTITSVANMSNNRVLTASGSTTINGEANLTFDGNALTLFGSGVVSADSTGLAFRQTGTYSDGRYEHRFRKLDEGGGIPLYVDKTEGTAGAHTQIARFGSYTSNPEEFEVYGALKATGPVSTIRSSTSGQQTALRVDSGSGTGGYFNVKSNVGNVNTDGNVGLHVGWNKSNGGREVNMIFDGGTGVSDTEMIFTSTDGSNYYDIFQINGAGNVDIKNGALRMGTTEVIDSSRNFKNAASLDSLIYKVDGKQFLYTPNNNTVRGPYNPVIESIRQSGKPLTGDEDFNDGSNSVSVYNNAGGGVVTHSRVTATDEGFTAPNSSGKVIKIVHNGGTSSPGFGGFVQGYSSGNNKMIVQIFVAKLPVGRSLNTAQNSQGSNATNYFLTSNTGTGKFETYVRIANNGDGGTFSSGGHVYVSGGSGGFTWYLASCNSYVVTRRHTIGARQVKASLESNSPAFMRHGDTDTGMCFPGADQVGLTAGNSRKLHITSTTATFQNLTTGLNVSSGALQVAGVNRIDSSGNGTFAQVTGNALVLGGGNSNASIYRTSSGSGFHFTTNAIYPTDNSGQLTNGTTDLGSSSYKYKDIHIGGVIQQSGVNRIDSNGNFFASDHINIGDDATIEDYDVANSIRIKGQQASNQGYIAFGTQTAKLGCNNSATLTYSNNFQATGRITATSYVVAGSGSGGVALTHNDGYGNANVTFNHVAGTPEQNGAAARIVVNTDASAEGLMEFEMSSAAVSNGVTVNLPVGMAVAHDYVEIPDRIRHQGDTNTYFQFNAADSARIVTGGTSRLLADSNGVTIKNSPLLLDGNDISGIGSIQIGSDTVIDASKNITCADITISDGTPLFKMTDSSNGGGGAAEGKILFSNTAGDALGLGYTSNIQTNSDFLISSDAGGTFGGHLGLDSGAITDNRSHIILEPKTALMLANGGTNAGAIFQIGLPGNGSNNQGCFFSIEGNCHTDGEGTGRLFFREHNSSTASADNYGMSIGYRGGNTSIATAMGNTNTSAALVSNGQWFMTGHNNSNQGALVMYGDRAATFIDFNDNHLRNVERIYMRGSNSGSVTYITNSSSDGTGYLQVQTSTGYTRIGPGNSSFSHFYTDRPEYYFNVGISVDSGIIRSHNEDMQLRRAGSGSHEITLTTDGARLADAYSLFLYQSSGTSGGNIHMPRAGIISFYGDTSMNHSISSRNQSNAEADDIMISSYGAVYIDLDSNANNTSGADFVIGRHNSTSSNMFSVSGEDGDTIAAGDVTAFGSPSDIRLKENIEVIADPLSKVLKLKGVTFNYKDTGKKSTGLIAQDLEEVLPEVVYETHDINDDNNKFKAVRYGNTVGLLVEAIKEQQTIINRLEERIKKLEGEK